MKKILVIIITFFSLHFAVTAQNTGYMGRYVLFNAECSLSPSWLNPNPLTAALQARFPGNESAQKYLGLNYIVSPSIEAIVWRKGTVGAGYNFYKSPFDGYTPRWVDYYSTDGYNVIYNFDEYFDYRFTGNIIAHGFNVFYKQYLGDTRAPMGPYIKFVFDGFFYKFDHHDENGNTVPSDVIMSYPEMAVNQGSLFGMKFEFGRDYLLFKFLRLSTGVSIGTTFGGYKCVSIIDEYPEHVEDKTPNNYARNRILGAYWFGLKVGVGFLTF